MQLNTYTCFLSVKLDWRSLATISIWRFVHIYIYINVPVSPGYDARFATLAHSTYSLLTLSIYLSYVQCSFVFVGSGPTHGSYISDTLVQSDAKIMSSLEVSLTRHFKTSFFT